MPSVPEPLAEEILGTFGRVTYTHKTHEKQAEVCQGLARTTKIANVVVIGITAGAALVSPLVESAAAAWATAASALIALMFATAQLSFSPAQDAADHRLAAKSYLELRDRYLRLLADAYAGELAATELRERRDALARDLEHVNRTAPQTSPRAYQRARSALNDDEGLTFSEGEYDQLLPGALRRVRSSADVSTPPAVVRSAGAADGSPGTSS